MIEPPPGSSEGLITFTSQTDPRQFYNDWNVESLPPHRKEYLTYEGPISGGRGSVQRVATGLLTWIRFGPDAATFKLQHMEFLAPPFAGWPTGQYCLTAEPMNRWRMSRIKEPA
jgi:hypothetical protein